MLPFWMDFNFGALLPAILAGVTLFLTQCFGRAV